MVQPVARRGLVKIEGSVPPTIFRFIAQLPGYSKWTDNGGVQFAASKVHIDLWKVMFPEIEIQDVDGSIAKLYTELLPIIEVPRLLKCPDPQPREHQNRAHNIIQCRDVFGMFYDMGTGKSCIITQGAAELYAKKKIERALVVTTKRGLPQFLNEQLPMWMPRSVRYRAAQLPSTQAKHRFQYPGDDLLVAFCAPGTFQSKTKSEKLIEFCKGGKTAIFVDECFPAGTKISTPLGYRNIEDFKPGDLIYSSDRVRLVQNATISMTKVLTSITLADGRNIQCTPNHSFFTDLGWVQARNLKNRIIYDQQDVRILRNGRSNLVGSMVKWNQTYCHASILQQILFSEMEEQKFPGISRKNIFKGSERKEENSTHRSEKTNAFCFENEYSFSTRSEGQNFCYTKAEGSQTNSARGQRQEFDNSSDNVVEDFRAGVGIGICNNVGWTAARLSKQLQGRFGFSPGENCYRSRRHKPQHTSSSGVRQEEGQQTEGIRVASVEIVECESPRTVFNLSIEGTPHYYAEGFLVHNCQNFKGWSTTRVDNLLRLKPHSTHRFLFSGEPEPKGYEDLFAQFFFMDENIFGHASLTSFMNQYCVLGGYQVKEIIDYKNTNELAAKIAPHCEYLKITDCMDMPDQDWQEVKFEVTQQQRDLYQQLKREFMICVEVVGNSNDRELVRRTCKNAASKFTVMAQVSNGFFYKDMVEEGDPRDIVRITDERARFVWEEVVGASKKCIVYARFHEDLAQLQRVAEELGIDAVEFSGRVKDKQCELNKLRFQNDPKCRGFFGTTASGGESLNLQVSCRTGYHSNTFNWGHRIQSERRTWRGGQINRCQYIDVVGLPIDRLILNNLLGKEDTSEQLKLATKLAGIAAQL